MSRESITSMVSRIYMVPPSGSNGESEAMAEHLNTIERETARCGEIVRSLLQFASRDHGEKRIQDLRDVVDRAAGEVVVFNSNRFTIIDRIRTPDPTSLAMSPNLDLLAVSNQTAGTVTFVDIDPTSATFHQIVKTTKVGNGPLGIAWEPGNEDIIVCNTGDSTVSIISATRCRLT